MTIGRLLLTLALAVLATACQTPQSIPTPGGGAPAPPTPAGTSAPSAPASPSGTTSQPPEAQPAGDSSTASGEQSGGGELDAGDTATPAGGDEPGDIAGIDEAGGTTGTGDTDTLDEQLDDSLDEFDETVAGGGPGQAADAIDILGPMGGASGNAEFEDPGFEEGELGEEGSPVENDALAERAEAGAGTAGAATEQGDAQQTASAAGSAEEGEGDTPKVPDDVGEGRDDNIVMRQIREAAMKEQDPELREKLWDEYRRIRDAR